jgi:hypothetical protein
MLKATVLALTLAIIPAWSGVTFIDASGRGWVTTGGSSNNGAGSGNNYIAGQLNSSDYRNWFEFTIPSFSGTLISATLDLTKPPGGHDGGTLVYSIYALDQQPLQFTDVSGDVLYGTVNTKRGGNANVTIALDAAALAAIESDAGGAFFVGGINSGESGNSDAYDFGGSNQRDRSLLILNTVPEPNMAIVLVSLMSGLLVRERLRSLCR